MWLSNLLLVAVIVLLPMRLTPPPEYQGSNVAIVGFVNSQEEMNRLCQQTDPDWDTLGCVYENKDPKKPDVMFISNPCNYPYDMYARHVCHELGHVNGWAGDHPNAQEYKAPQTYLQTHPEK
jgi:hypothetical protein